MMMVMIIMMMIQVLLRDTFNSTSADYIASTNTQLQHKYTKKETQNQTAEHKSTTTKKQ
jgi:hypothetical protein